MLIAGMIPLAKINILYCSKPIYMAQKAVFSLVSSKEKIENFTEIQWCVLVFGGRRGRAMVRASKGMLW